MKSKSLSFYHLTRSPLAQALPKLLEKTDAQGKKAIIRLKDEDRIEKLSHNLWAYGEPTSWLAHGFKDMNPSVQPIWITHSLDNPSYADYLFMVENASIEHFEDYERAFYLFDGKDEEELQRARTLWMELKAQSVELVYFKQDENGSWHKHM